MTQKYYVYLNEEVQGPHDLNKLFSMNLPASTKVCPEGSTEWQELNQLRFNSLPQNNSPSSMQSSNDYVPSQVGKYQVSHEIGRGGMGSVYLALDDILNRKVAIKELKIDEHKKKDADSYNTLIRRFKKEAQVLAQLNHKNIVAVFDVLEQNGNQYIIMEYLEGRDLEGILDEYNVVPIDMSVSIIADVCLALDYIHKKNIIHRDIKPSNIFILNDGVVKLTDFGVTRDLNSVTMTIDGSLVGTIAYASPEQDSRELDGRSDIFSLGVVLYELVTGQKPFTGDTIASVLLKIATKDPVKPSQVNNKVHKMLENIILKAMSKNLNNRYASALDMYNDLIAYKEALENNNEALLNASRLGSPLSSGSPFMSLKPENEHSNQAPPPVKSTASLLSNKGTNTLNGQKIPDGIDLKPIENKSEQIHQPIKQEVIENQASEEDIQNMIRNNSKEALDDSPTPIIEEEAHKEDKAKSKPKVDNKKKKKDPNSVNFIIPGVISVIGVVLFFTSILSLFDVIFVIGASFASALGYSQNKENKATSYFLTFLCSVLLFVIAKSFIPSVESKISSAIYYSIDGSILLIAIILSVFIRKALNILALNENKNLRPIGSVLKSLVAISSIILFISSTGIIDTASIKKDLKVSKVASLLKVVVPKFEPGKKLPISIGKPSTVKK
jgi:serine/threonine protein kinase